MIEAERVKEEIERVKESLDKMLKHARDMALNAQEYESYGTEVKNGLKYLEKYVSDLNEKATAETAREVPGFEPPWKDRKKSTQKERGPDGMPAETEKTIIMNGSDQIKIKEENGNNESESNIEDCPL